VRHRLASFTQESQRYTEARIVKAIAKAYGRDPGGLSIDEAHELALSLTFGDLPECLFTREGNEKCERALRVASELFVIPPGADRLLLADHYLRSLVQYLYLRKRGVKMEDARYALPQAVRTSLLATANLREWMHIVRLRSHPKAQWEIREIVGAIADLIEEHVGVGVRQTPSQRSR
jgi:thymidylate synthase (FAD)